MDQLTAAVAETAETLAKLEAKAAQITAAIDATNAELGVATIEAERTDSPEAHKRRAALRSKVQALIAEQTEVDAALPVVRDSLADGQRTLAEAKAAQAWAVCRGLQTEREKVAEQIAATVRKLADQFEELAKLGIQLHGAAPSADEKVALFSAVSPLQMVIGLRNEMAKRSHHLSWAQPAAAGSMAESIPGLVETVRKSGAVILARCAD
ncbi:hypothetical protein [Niveibacterium sp.]|uniref:hypothetical protein n=1 Tax=Niveibacterium sp. TaxID=2017444 RepID=UPI0035B4C7DD